MSHHGDAWSAKISLSMEIGLSFAAGISVFAVGGIEKRPGRCLSKDARRHAATRLDGDSTRKSVAANATTYDSIAWYRRSPRMTAMVAGTMLFLGPVLGPFILIVLATGPIYTKGASGDPKTWDLSTKGLVFFFAALITVLWVAVIISRLS